MEHKTKRVRPQIDRRVFLKASAATLAGVGVTNISCHSLRKGKSAYRVRFGMVTDIHYADANTKGTRYYRHSLDKLTECVQLLNEQKVDFLIELGDFKDQNTPPQEAKTLAYLQEVEKGLQQFSGPIYHVLGNHDVDSISKAQFLAHVTNTDQDRSRTYYSFDRGGIHFVVLDANYQSNGSDYDHGNFDWTDTNIPSQELAWLEQDLAASPQPTIVCIHQLLDGKGDVYVNNAAAVRQILQKSGNVLAVFQGHHHAGSLQSIEDIHYYTLKATVEGPAPENNSYAIVEVKSNLDIVVTGYRNAVSSLLGS
jgi:predicted phosphodiesterase